MDKHQKSFNNFAKLCLSTKDRKMFLQLMKFLLTPEERNNISKRYLVVEELLKKEKTQREIASEFDISIAKITRGSNELKIIDEALLTYLKKHMKVNDERKNDK